MAPASIHQAIHGYRDGHRLLSSSIPLAADASRAMLVLSDMSGPSMHSGFDEYLTGYPLPSTDLFVFAKTWYAPEMQRPGCVWTHSLLISREHISEVSAPRLLANLRRPHLEGMESSATSPIVVDDASDARSTTGGFADKLIAAALIGAVLGQARPVIVAVDAANQLESAFLRLWDELWPAAKARFSFCTGALMPRTVAGVLMDIQAVPRAVPSSQFRRSAGSALVLDLRAPVATVAWVDVLLESTSRGDTAFRSWMEAAAGAEVSRGAVSNLMPIFGQWHAANWSGRDVLAYVVGAPELEFVTRARLVGMVFDRAGSEAGPTSRRELLQDLCGRRDADLSSMTSLLEEQTRRLFDESRADGCALVLSLLGAELAELGERVLRAAVRLLVPNDLETFGDAQAPFLPTIVGANPALAASPVLWKRVGSRATEVLSQLTAANLSDAERGGVIDAVFMSGSDAPIDALIRFGGKVAILRALTALASSQIQFSWQWRSALSAQPAAVLDWLDGHPSLTPQDLDLGTRFLSPKANPSRLAKVWQTGTASGAATLSPRVAAFGLALAFAEGNTRSALIAVCFQPTYDAANRSHLEYEEWDWLQEQAPPVSWWRDWDKCERLAAALARLLERQNASLETVFGIVHSRHAVRKVAIVLDDDRDTRRYLKSLRKMAEASSSIGTREQRDALLEAW